MRTWLVCAWAFLLAGCVCCYPSSDNAPLHVAVMPDYPPLVSRDDNANLVGLEIDLARELGKELGRDVVFHEYFTLDDMFAALGQGRVNMAMSGISITAERQQHFAFSLPYAAIGQMAMIRLRDASRISDVATLRNGPFRIGYQRGSTGEVFVREHVQSESVGYNSNTELLSALLAGDIDAFIHDAPTIWELANHEHANGQLIGLHTLLTHEALAWVLPKGDGELLNDVNAALTKWADDGFLAQTKRQWMPVKIVSGDEAENP